MIEKSKKPINLKITDNEIVKALECCLDVSPSTCKNCPLFNVTSSTMVCSKIATKFALDLINRQKAEIERLRKEIDVTDSANTELYGALLHAKAEAIKEFAERLKKELRLSTGNNGGFVPSIIDNLVKEMVGDNE